MRVLCVSCAVESSRLKYILLISEKCSQFRQKKHYSGVSHFSWASSAGGVKIRNTLFFVAISTLCCFSQSCKKRSSFPTSLIFSGNSVGFQLESSEFGLVNYEQLSPTMQNIANKIFDRRPVLFSELRDALIESQVRIYNQKAAVKVTYDELKNFLDDLQPAIYPADLPKLKTEIEDIYRRKIGFDSVYNSEAKSVVNIYKDHALQCYSGTIFLLIQFLNHPDFKQMNPVVIFERGHVLPGFMQWQSSPSDEGKYPNPFTLFGIESTALGTATVNFVSDSENGEYLLVDAFWYILIEIFKNDLADSSSLVSKSLFYTEQTYALKVHRNIVGRIDQLDKEVLSKIPNSFTSNWSPFSFGVANVTKGNQERTHLNQIIQNTVPRGDQVGARIDIELLNKLEFDGKEEFIKSLPKDKKEIESTRLPSGLVSQALYYVYKGYEIYIDWVSGLIKN